MRKASGLKYKTKKTIQKTQKRQRRFYHEQHRQDHLRNYRRHISARRNRFSDFTHHRMALMRYDYEFFQ